MGKGQMNIDPGFVRTLLSSFWGARPTGKALCEAATGDYNQAYYAFEPSQIVYALRFLPAYYFEYCALAADLYPRVVGSQEVNFLSLGCGLCPDYFAIQHNLRNIPFSYYGCDAVDWTAFRLMPATGSNFVRSVAAAEAIVEDDLHWADVYLFPKSLGDIKGPTLEIVAKRIAQTPKKRIFFLNSYVTYSFAIAGNRAPFYAVHQELLNAGFSCQDDVSVAYRMGETECALRRINSSFDFPSEYELRCEHYPAVQTGCGGCEAKRSPLFKNTRMSYAVLEYIKS